MKVNYIDTSTVESKVEVMRAHANGAKIASRSKIANTINWEADWIVVEPKWNWAQYDYAVIVEPREVWVVYDPQGNVSSTIQSKQESALLPPGFKLVRFVEVCDDHE